MSAQQHSAAVASTTGALVASGKGAPAGPQSTPAGVGTLQTQVITRTLFVHIQGSLTNLAMAGPQAAMWKPQMGKETEVFCPSFGSNMDPAEAVNSIRGGVIRRLTIKGEQSTFPYALGVKVSCVPESEVTDIGQKYTYTVLPHSTISAPQDVYRCEPASLPEGSMWRQQYPEWNANNLETHGVMDFNGQPFLFVHMKHPAIGMLRNNSDMIGCNIDEQPMFQDTWHQISRQVMGVCCQTLRGQVLSMLSISDMNLFGLQLQRLDSDTWDELGDGVVALQGFRPKAKWTPEEHDREKEHHLRLFVTTPYHYTARLEVEYEVPTAGAAQHVLA